MLAKGRLSGFSHADYSLHSLLSSLSEWPEVTDNQKEMKRTVPFKQLKLLRLPRPLWLPKIEEDRRATGDGQVPPTLESRFLLLHRLHQGPHWQCIQEGALTNQHCGFLYS